MYTKKNINITICVSYLKIYHTQIGARVENLWVGYS